MKRHIFLIVILLTLSLGALALPAMGTSGEYCETLQADGTDNCDNTGPDDPIVCPDGTEVPNGQPCPPVPCSDGSTVPNGQTCPPIQCNHSGPVPDGEECPPHQCPDGTILPDDVPCPSVQCPDGSGVPNGQTCPPVQCPDGTEVPNGQSCPPVQCPDGTEVPNGEPCPPVLCPDGTKVPNGQHCPKPDLIGKLAVRQMSKQVASVTIRVTNTGTAPALSAADGGYVINVGLFRSASSKVPITGTKKVQIKTTNTLPPGSSETFQVDIPLTSNLQRPQDKVIVCADIDPEKSVKETNEDNNRTCQAI